MSWHIILNDNTRHEIEAEVRFEVKGGRKVVDATADGNQSVLHAAFNSSAVILESPNGHQHEVTIESITNGIARIKGV